MTDITEGDRVRITHPLSQKHDGKEGTVQWRYEEDDRACYGVLLDGEESGRTFFPHELEKIEE